MLIEDSFEVPEQADRVWAFLLDVERVAPCMPGAELTEIVDDRTWKGKVAVKIGPVGLSFAGTAVMEERDDIARRAVLRAEGTEVRGKGAATAVLTSRLEAAADGGTRVLMQADVSLSGAAAQYGRGMITDISKRLTRQFADCLRDRLTKVPEGPQPSGEATVPAARPIGGLRLGAWALVRALGRFFGRVWGAIAGSGRRPSRRDRGGAET
jgi:carbon monoxide dehydrogenase subunit G